MHCTLIQACHWALRVNYVTMQVCTCERLLGGVHGDAGLAVVNPRDDVVKEDGQVLRQRLDQPDVAPCDGASREVDTTGFKHENRSLLAT